VPGTIAAMTQQGEPAHRLRYGPPDPPSPSTRTTEEQPPSARVAAWPLGVLLVAGLAGAAVGAATYALGKSGSDNGWEQLGAFLLGIVLGLVTFGATYFTGLVLAARRAFTRGRRVLPVVLALAIPAGIAALATVLGTWVERSGSNSAVLGLAAAAGVLAAPSAAFAWSGTRRTRQRLALATGALVCVMLAVTAASIALRDRAVDAAAKRLPLVLFDGTTAEAPIVGLRRDTFTTITITHGVSDTDGIDPGSEHVHLRYFAQAGFVYLTMHSGIGPCHTSPSYTCRVTGELWGNEIRHYDRLVDRGYYPHAASFDVLVYPDGRAVSVTDDGYRQGPGQLQVPATQLMERLVRVDRRQFERATGSRLRLP
jgi:hypothetical protein